MLETTSNVFNWSQFSVSIFFLLLSFFFVEGRSFPNDEVANESPSKIVICVDMIEGTHINVSEVILVSILAELNNAHKQYQSYEKLPVEHTLNNGDYSAQKRGYSVHVWLPHSKTVHDHVSWKMYVAWQLSRMDDRWV